MANLGGGGSAALSGVAPFVISGAAGAVTALLVNPSTATGLLQDWQVNNVSKASIDSTGKGTFNGGLVAANGNFSVNVNGNPLLANAGYYAGGPGAAYNNSTSYGLDQIVFANAGSVFKFATNAGVPVASIDSTGKGTFNGGIAVPAGAAFNNIAQAVAITAPAATAATNVAPFGYSTQAQADAIVTAVRALQAAIKNIGITA